MRSIISGILLTLLAFAMLTSTLNVSIQPVRSEPKTIIVPDNYSTIQEAIDNAVEGDTIYVKTGTYYENILVTKRVKLIGENRTNTVIDGNGTGNVVKIKADNVTISGFMIRNSGLTTGWSFESGVLLEGVNYVRLVNNMIVDNRLGVMIGDQSSNLSLTGNVIANNSLFGAYFISSNNNVIRENSIVNNFGGLTCYNSEGNTLIGNNLTDNEGSSIALVNSGGNTFSNNSVIGNYSLNIDADDLSGFLQNIDTSNTANGKPIYYLINQNNLTIEPSTFPSIGSLALVNSTNITVRNVNITKGGHGIIFAFTQNSSIYGNNIAENWYGIFSKYSDENVINDNYIADNYADGIIFDHSSNNNVSGNIVDHNNMYGFTLESSSNNTLTNNNITNNEHNFNIEGNQLGDFVNYVDVSNIVNGKPIYYLLNQNNLIVNVSTFPSIGYLALVNSTKVSVENSTLINNGQGLLFAYTNNSRVKNNDITNNMDGIAFYGSFNNTIFQNNITKNHVGLHLEHTSNNAISKNSLIDNSLDGVYAYDLSNNTFSENNITSNERYGILLFGSSLYNTISRNNIINNRNNGVYIHVSTTNTISENQIINNTEHGIYIYLSSNNTVSKNYITDNGQDGLQIFQSSDSNVFRNNITDNNCGIRLWSHSGNNSMSANNVADNSYGICFGRSSNNFICHNNFINNTDQVYDRSSENPIYAPSINIWDDGYPSGGNYWSDYNGADLFLGPSQNETGSDGIGDTPYNIDENNTDYYPLMNPWITPDTAVLDINSSKNVVGEGFGVNITVIVENQGNKVENLSTFIYANETLIQFQTFLLKSGDSLIYTFTWNTTGVAKGNYTIKAIAEPVLGETDLADNIKYGDQEVCVAILGDINGDMKVDLSDVLAVALAFGSRPGDPLWSPNLDIDGNEKVDLTDYLATALNYGHVDP